MIMRFLCFGEILFDEISGEKRLGGAPFNLAAGLAVFGHEVFLASSLGDDALGKKALSRVKELGIRTDLILIDKNKPTGQVDVLADGQGEPAYKIAEDAAYDFIRYDKKKLNSFLQKEFNCFCFGTLIQRHEVSRSSLNLLAKKIRTKEFFCDLNLRKGNYSEKSLVNSLKISTILKLNIKEAKFLMSHLYKKRMPLKELASFLFKDYKIRTLAVTCGPDGASAFSGYESAKAAGIRVESGETIGAGDAFSAGFLSEYLSSRSLKKACKKGNESGARAVFQR